MKKILALLLTVTLLFSGCSSEPVTIDAKKLAEDLYHNVTFEDELSPVDEEMVKMLYDIDNFTAAYVYIGSGATAEEIAVFEFETSEDAKEAFDIASQRMEDRKADFESYIPKEVKKLDEAVVRQEGNYLAVCVSDGNEAEKIVSEYMK